MARYFGIITLRVRLYSWTYDADITSSLRDRDLYLWFRDEAMREATEELPFLGREGSPVTLFYSMEEVTNDQS